MTDLETRDKCRRCQMPKAASLQDYLDHGFYLESGEPANSLCGDHLSGSPYAHVHCRDVTITRLSTDLTRVKAELAAAEGRIRDLDGLINTPQVDDFLEAVRTEAAHQCERWGTEHDAGKEPQDWFWLLGYLSGKALASAVKDDRDKALHHTISSAAVLLNWHAHISGTRTEMRPGIEPPKALDADDALTSAADGAGGGGTGT